jgi:hypothetical protein
VSHAKSSLRCKPFLYLIHTLPRLLIVSAWILRSACTSGIQHRSQFISSISLHVRLGGCYNPLVVTPPPVQVNRGEARFEQARCCADQAHLFPWRNTDRGIPYGVPQRRKRASPLQYVDPFRLFILYSHRKLPCQVHDARQLLDRTHLTATIQPAHLSSISTHPHVRHIGLSTFPSSRNAQISYGPGPPGPVEMPGASGHQVRRGRKVKKRAKKHTRKAKPCGNCKRSHVRCDNATPKWSVFHATLGQC